MSTLRDVKRWLATKGEVRARGQVPRYMIDAYNRAHPDDPYEVPAKVVRYTGGYRSDATPEHLAEQRRRGGLNRCATPRGRS